ncbi:hypothetical protein NQ314_004888 [Rhamnusium bicolor]|uniref:Uncharacterized protein n=1 Tax=Rhamnusium bicolor TaxID=1586634 RepID=A0AAV8ZLF3_9CUCU|nr:hypothetical protein NQ314_004888 [Rhamnusium bicolor]
MDTLIPSNPRAPSKSGPARFGCHKMGHSIMSSGSLYNLLFLALERDFNVWKSCVVHRFISLRRSSNTSG